MRLGVLGGTFNPIHNGHLRLADEAIDAFGLDQMLLVLSAVPPHKDNHLMTPASVRWNLLGLACEGNPKLIPSPLEMERSGPSYTIDTLAEIRKNLQQDDEIFLVVGMDCAEEIRTWRDYRTILETVHVVVARRGSERMGTLPEDISSHIRYLDTPCLDISSTRIRQLAREGKSLRYLLPEAVRLAILEKGIYASQAGEALDPHSPVLGEEAVA
jgi:nicotinate-nucleotide adenylyltransferase